MEVLVLDFLKVFFMCMHGCSMGPVTLVERAVFP